MFHCGPKHSWAYSIFRNNEKLSIMLILANYTKFNASNLCCLTLWILVCIANDAIIFHCGPKHSWAYSIFRKNEKLSIMLISANYTKFNASNLFCLTLLVCIANQIYMHKLKKYKKLNIMAQLKCYSRASTFNNCPRNKLTVIIFGKCIES